MLAAVTFYVIAAIGMVATMRVPAWNALTRDEYKNFTSPVTADPSHQEKVLAVTDGNRIYMFLILLHLPPHLFVSDCFCVLLWTGHTGAMAPQATGLILPSYKRTVYAKP